MKILLAGFARAGAAGVALVLALLVAAVPGRVMAQENIPLDRAPDNGENLPRCSMGRSCSSTTA